MSYDWEFDGSVDFAPQNYRLKKYKECEELGKQINDEISAEEFLQAFEYINYLSDTYISEIDNWNKLVGYEEMALSMLKSKEAIFKWIVYPSQHQMWKLEFNNLRHTEKDVGKTIDLPTYIDKIYDFNMKYTDINRICHKYNMRGHTLYWVKDIILKHDIRQQLDFKNMDKSDKIDFLTLYGVVSRYDYGGA